MPRRRSRANQFSRSQIAGSIRGPYRDGAIVVSKQDVAAAIGIEIAKAFDMPIRRHATQRLRGSKLARAVELPYRNDTGVGAKKNIAAAITVEVAVETAIDGVIDVCHKDRDGLRIGQA